jgi:hypothetical protein
MAILLTSCKTEPILPKEEVSFSKQVLPIITGNCSMSGCHGNINPEEGKLTNYNEVMSYGEVEYNNAKNSKLYKAITDLGEERMPLPPRPQLSEKQIATIYIWIQQGAKDN